jgi:hypothetical protein
MHKMHRGKEASQEGNNSSLTSIEAQRGTTNSLPTARANSISLGKPLWVSHTDELRHPPTIFLYNMALTNHAIKETGTALQLFGLANKVNEMLRSSHKRRTVMFCPCHGLTSDCSILTFYVPRLARLLRSFRISNLVPADGKQNYFQDLIVIAAISSELVKLLHNIAWMAGACFK